jgi:hypothetical protein
MRHLSLLISTSSSSIPHHANPSGAGEGRGMVAGQGSGFTARASGDFHQDLVVYLGYVPSSPFD